MTINVLAFGIVKEIFGERAISVELQDGATVSVLVQMLKDRYPAINKLSSFAVAVNGAYATNETVISGNFEVAIIPPVSGG